jgi:threonine/homoserine/homoserine lactone efflux protein
MGFEGFFALMMVCAVGAMTPGPSLAVILRHARVGRLAGLAAAVGHGAAVLLYALLVVFGLQVVTNLFPSLVLILRLAGAVWLLWMAWKLWRTAQADSEQRLIDGSGTARAISGALDGFSIAFFNPKIAVFMLAIFSQWLYVGQPFWEKLMMATIAGVVDGVWYLLVAMVLSQGAVVSRLSGAVVDRILSVLLFALAGFTAADAWQERSAALFSSGQT